MIYILKTLKTQKTNKIELNRIAKSKCSSTHITSKIEMEWLEKSSREQ